MRAVDVAEARRRAGADDDDLRPQHAASTSNATAWPGLFTLSVYLQARRGLLFERFLNMWQGLERDAFAHRLSYATAERPVGALTSDSQDDHATPVESATGA
jgi:hypothetical protein